MHQHRLDDHPVEGRVDIFKQVAILRIGERVEDPKRRPRGQRRCGAGARAVALPGRIAPGIRYGAAQAVEPPRLRDPQADAVAAIGHDPDQLAAAGHEDVRLDDLPVAEPEI